jgi:hypothetical protein
MNRTLLTSREIIVEPQKCKFIVDYPGPKLKRTSDKGAKQNVVSNLLVIDNKGMVKK